MTSISFSPANQQKLDTIRAARREVLVDLFQGDATKDAARIAARFSADAVFQIGALPPVTGRPAVEGMLRGFFEQSPFLGLEHELLEVYDLEEALLWRANAMYRMPDGSIISTPYMNRVRFVGNECVDYRVHLDLSVLRAR